MRRGPKPAKSKEAKPPVARKAPKDDGSGLGDVEKRLAEALRDKAEALKREAEAREQQTATAEILRIIGSSPTDVQPVFDAIARNALRLCQGSFSTVLRLENGLIHAAARTNFDEQSLAGIGATYPVLVDSPELVAQA